MENEEKEYPRLCVGTFLTLLVGARKTRQGSRSRDYKKADGLSNTDLLIDLIRLADTDYSIPDSESNSFVSITSQIKNCRKDESDYFNPKLLLDRIEARLQSPEQMEVCSDCEKIIEKYIDGGINNKKLASALIWMIKNDPQLTSDENISNRINQSMRDAILSIDNGEPTRLSLPVIFEYVWLYILRHVPVNSCGKDTIIKWGNDYKAERDIVDALSKEYSDLIIPVLKDADARIRDFQNRVVIPGKDQVAPEILPDKPVYVVRTATNIVDEKDISHVSRYEKYLDGAAERYSKIKTLLYDKEAKSFYDFYIPNDLFQFGRGRRPMDHCIRQLFEHIVRHGKFVRRASRMLITGVGGLGKSMAMRNIFLRARHNLKGMNSIGRIPFLVSVKGYKDDRFSIVQLILSSAQNFDDSIKLEEIVDLLEKGKAIVLLDGLDEIAIDLRKGFEEKLNGFISSYPYAHIVASSRPYSDFLSLDFFSKYQLCPFSKDQALLLIDKLEFQPDEPAFKERFKKALNERLFASHRGFTENPMLLTLMLMTFNYNGDISSSLFSFYGEAFLTLAKRHDASKAGFERQMATGLDVDSLSKLLSIFCAKSFVNHRYDYTREQMDTYFTEAKKYYITQYKGMVAADTEAFISDIEDNICLIYFEDSQYHYIHRSFQEYFTALYFSRLMDDKLPNLAEFINKTGSQSGVMLNMLYELIPDKVEKFIFLPYLRKLFTECDNDDIDPYLSFICSEYPYLQATEGDTIVSENNEPARFLYGYIARKSSNKREPDTYMFPTNESFLEQRFVYATDDQSLFDKPEEWELWDEQEVPGLFLETVGEGEFAGALCSYDMYDIVHNPDDRDFQEIVGIITDDHFALKIEFGLMRQYTKELEDKYSETENGDFGLF